MAQSNLPELEKKFNILADDLQITKSRLKEAKTHIKILNKFSSFSNYWKRNVINPYTTAYENALTSYNHTIKLDEEAEKARLEMAFMVLSLFGGSALTAVLGNVKWGKTMKNMGINYICDNNMKRTFNALHVYENSPVTQFILGQTLKEGKKILGAKVKDSILTAKRPGTYGKMTSAAIVGRNLENLYIGAEQSVRDALDDILSSKKGNTNIAARRLALDKLMQSPFCQPPRKINFVQDTVSLEIELGFFMKMVLESDTFVKPGFPVT